MLKLNRVALILVYYRLLSKQRSSFSRHLQSDNTQDRTLMLIDWPSAIRVQISVRIVIPIGVPIETVQVLLIESLRIHPHKPPDNRIVVARAEVAQPRVLIKGLIVEELPVACRGWLILGSLSVRPIVLPPENVARRIGGCDGAAGHIGVQVGDGFRR